MTDQVRYPAAPVILVDDESQILFSFGMKLRSSGITHLVELEDGRDLVPTLSQKDATAVVLDLTMPHISGEALMATITRDFPHIPVIIVTGTDDLDTAVACMKGGAFDYLVKPVAMARLIATVQKAVDLTGLREEVASLRRKLLDGNGKASSAFGAFVTDSKKMVRIFQYLEAVSLTQQPILISGETGVGKELIARAVHQLSGRKGGFSAINAAGLDDAMFSDTLFGHRKGAFTGADQERQGLIAQAAGGTLFLDEIGDLTEASQVKLLRLLQEQVYFPLGSDVARTSDARIIAATNHDLQKRMADHAFRKDLYFRLRTHQVHIPPLRERPEDLPPLIAHFFDEASASLGKKRPTYPPELLGLLAGYAFPGNVRELRGMVHDAVAQHQRGVLSLESFRKIIRESNGPLEPPVSARERETGMLQWAFTRFPTLKEAENHLVSEAMKTTGDNQGAAAALLGISRQALNKRLLKKKKPSA